MITIDAIGYTSNRETGLNHFIEDLYQAILSNGHSVVVLVRDQRTASRFEFLSRGLLGSARSILVSSTLFGLRRQFYYLKLALCDSRSTKRLIIDTMPYKPVFFPGRWMYIPTLHDIKYFRSDINNFFSFRVFILKAWIYYSLITSRLAITVSEDSRLKIRNLFGTRCPEILVSGVSVENVRTQFPVSRSWNSEGPQIIYLCISENRPHKNLEWCVKEAERFISSLGRRADSKTLRFIFVGMGTERLKEFVSTNLESFFEFRGYVGRQQLIDLLGVTFALVFPSREEGFGIPAVIAADNYIPVIVSSDSVMSSLLGQGCITFEGWQFNALVQGLARAHHCSKKDLDVILEVARANVSRLSRSATHQPLLEKLEGLTKCSPS